MEPKIFYSVPVYLSPTLFCTFSHNIMEYTTAVIQPLLRKEFGPASSSTVETYQDTDNMYIDSNNHYGNNTFGNWSRGGVSSVAATLGRLTGLTGAIAIFLVVLFFIVLPIALHILAIYLAATCNRGQVGNQIGAILIALIFPIVYLIFYWIYHTLMGNPCNA